MKNSKSVAQENTQVVAKVKKSKIIKTKAPVAEVSIPATPVIEAPVAETPKAAKVERPKLDPSTIVPPANVKIEIKKSFTKIYSDTKKSALKGSLLEFSTVAENLDPRLHILTADEIKNGHLGTMKAILKGIKDNNDLQTILNSYFA